MNLANVAKVIALISAIIVTIYYGIDIFTNTDESQTVIPSDIEMTEITYDTYTVYNLFAEGDGAYYIMSFDKEIVPIDRETYMNTTIGGKVSIARKTQRRN